MIKHNRNYATKPQRMLKLEQKLNEAKTEAEKQMLLAKIAEEREFAQEMTKEAHHRRTY